MAALSSHSNITPFASYLQLVSFVATITISISISACQGFSTAEYFLGIPVTSNDATETRHTAQQAMSAAHMFAWAAATSALTLIISLIVQLLMTDKAITDHLEQPGRTIWHAKLKLAVGAASWLALGLQLAALALIGEGLKNVNRSSGLLIQVGLSNKSRLHSADCSVQCSLPVVVLPCFVAYLVIFHKESLRFYCDFFVGIAW